MQTIKKIVIFTEIGLVEFYEFFFDMKVEYTYFLLLKFYLDILRLLVSCPLMKGCNYGSTLKVALSGIDFWSKECLKNHYLCLHTKCLNSI